MNCEECLDLITAYLDDEIAAKEARDFEEHLLACDACRSEFQQMRMITDAVRSLPEVDLPLGFHERLLERLKTVAEQRGGSGDDERLRGPLAAFRRFAQNSYRRVRNSPYQGVAVAAVIIISVYALHMGGSSKKSAEDLAPSASEMGTGVNAYYSADSSDKSSYSSRGLEGEALLEEIESRALSQSQAVDQDIPEPAEGVKAPQQTNESDLAMLQGDEYERIRSTPGIQEVERKIIKQANLEVVVAPGKFGEAQKKLVMIAESNGGYMEESSIWLEGPEEDYVLPGFPEEEAASTAAEGEQPGTIDKSKLSNRRRAGRFVLRVSENAFSKAINATRDLGDVRSEHIGGRDVTSQFVDTRARRDALKVQEDRLLAILSRANTVDEMLRIENELARVRSEIESFTATLNNLDSLSRLSTLIVNLREWGSGSGSGTKPTVWSRIAAAFMDTLITMWEFSVKTLVFVSGAVPLLILVGLACLVVRLLGLGRKGSGGT